MKFCTHKPLVSLIFGGVTCPLTVQPALPALLHVGFVMATPLTYREWGNIMLFAIVNRGTFFREPGNILP